MVLQLQESGATEQVVFSGSVSLPMDRHDMNDSKQPHRLSSRARNSTLERAGKSFEYLNVQTKHDHVLNSKSDHKTFRNHDLAYLICRPSLPHQNLAIPEKHYFRIIRLGVICSSDAFRQCQIISLCCR